MKNLLNAINELSTEDRMEIYAMLSKEFGESAADDDDGFNF